MISSALVLALCLGQPAAANICDHLAPLTRALGKPDVIPEFTLAGQTVRCQHSLAIGGAASVHCAVPFDFRAPLATATFESALDDATTCGTSLDQTDPDVSHPDSYDLRRFVLPDATLQISLKDKGALSQTYIFVRLTGQGG
ncbi:MAG: hypothetical protein P8M63_14195 [Paracoccaceae bacterium]|jgi:hypothetical protein|nr:hypothetical protein [Paracoccaceae bacterium]